MREYELLYIVSGDKSESEATTAQDAISKILTDHKAKITSEDVQGRKRLAYEINKQQHGWYVVNRFEVEPAQLPEIQRLLSLNNDLARYLLVNAEDVPSEAEKAAQEAAAEAYPGRGGRDRDDKPAPKRAPAAAAKRTETKVEEAPALKEDAKTEEKKPELSEDERKAQLEEKLKGILTDDEKEDNA
jgi:small subunit ribosomal protein S6